MLKAAAKKPSAAPRAFGVQLQNTAAPPVAPGKSILKNSAAVANQQQQQQQQQIHNRRNKEWREVEVVVEVPALLAPGTQMEEVDLSDVVGEDGLCNMSLDESLELAAGTAAAAAASGTALPEVPEVPAIGKQTTAAASAAAALPSGVEDIDQLDDEDPQCVAEYVNDIYRFLRAKEVRRRREVVKLFYFILFYFGLQKRHQLDAQYMKKMQSDLNGGMRAILLDWLADVGLKVDSKKK